MSIDKRKDIAKILEENCHYSPQVGALVIHGAIDKIIEYFTPSLNAGSLEEVANKYANENGFKVISEDDDEGAASHKYIVDAVIYGASLSQGVRPLKDALEKIQAKQIPDSPHETQTFIAEVFNICDKALEPYKNSK